MPVNNANHPPSAPHEHGTRVTDVSGPEPPNPAQPASHTVGDLDGQQGKGQQDKGQQAKFSDAPVLEELCARARGGDERAFNELVTRTYDRAYGVALNMMRSQADARDIAQEAFIRVQRGLPDFQGQAKFTTWLYRVVVNLCLDHLRHRTRWKKQELDSLDRFAHSRRSPEQDTSDTEVAKALQAGLAELSEIHRATFLLYEVENLSYEEIAKVTGVRVGTVMSRLFYARKKMRDYLAPILGMG